MNLTDAESVISRTVAGSNGNWTSDGAVASARFNTPQGVAFISQSQSIVVADVRNRRIRKVDVEAATVSTVSIHGLPDCTMVAISNRTSAFFATGRQVFSLSLETGHADLLAGSTTGFEDGNASVAKFGEIRGIAIWLAGQSVLVADDANTRLRRVSLATGGVETLAGSEAGYADGVGAAAQFRALLAVAATGGRVFIADLYRIREVDLATLEVTTLAGGSEPGLVDGAGASAAFGSVLALAASTAYVWAADAGNGRIRRVDRATGEVLSVAGSGAAASADGPGVSAGLDFPWGLAVDSAGTTLAVTERGGHGVRLLSLASSEVRTVAGGASSGLEEGAGEQARFEAPGGVAMLGRGEVVVADTYNHAVRRVELGSGAVSTLAGAGVEGHRDGAAREARFRRPATVAVVPNASAVVVADAGNARVRVVDVASGGVRTVGPAVEGLWGAAVGEGSGGVWVFLSAGNQILRMPLDGPGQLEVVAGGEIAGFADGAGSAARFSMPRGLAVSLDGGSVLVADSGNGRVRRVELEGKSVSTLAGQGLALPGSSAVGSTGEELQAPQHLAIAVDGGSVLVTDQMLGTVVGVPMRAGAARTLWAAPQAGGLLAGVAVTADGKGAVVADAGRDAIVYLAAAARCLPCRSAVPVGAVFVGPGRDAWSCPWSCRDGAVPRTGPDDCEGCEAQRLAAPGLECEGCLRCECDAGFGRAEGGGCTPCAAGTFKGSVADSACELCAAGSFQGEVGASACAVCQPGQYQGARGATQCAACAEGSFGNASGAAGCEACGDPNAQSPEGSDGPEDCQCAPGYSGGGGQRCEACAPGTFKGAAGSAACEQCTFRPLGARFVASAAGPTTEDACEWACPEGEVLVPASLSAVVGSNGQCSEASEVSFTTALYGITLAEFEALFREEWVAAVAAAVGVDAGAVRIESLLEHKAEGRAQAQQRETLPAEGVLVETLVLVLPGREGEVRSRLSTEALQAQVPSLDVGPVVVDYVWAPSDPSASPAPVPLRDPTGASLFIVVGTVAAGVLLFLCGILAGLYYRKSQLADRHRPPPPPASQPAAPSTEEVSTVGDLVLPPPLPEVLRMHGLEPRLPRPNPLRPASPAAPVPLPRGRQRNGDALSPPMGGEVRAGAPQLEIRSDVAPPSAITPRHLGPPSSSPPSIAPSIASEPAALDPSAPSPDAPAPPASSRFRPVAGPPPDQHWQHEQPRWTRAIPLQATAPFSASGSAAGGPGPQEVGESVNTAALDLRPSSRSKRIP